MRRTTWVPVAAAAVLVVGVLAIRSTTAAAEQDLVPMAGPEPSATASAAPVEPGPVVLEANGLPGARLGSSGPRLRTGPLYGAEGQVLSPDDLPGGCVPAWSDYADGTVEEYDMSVWLVEGLVSSVVLTRWDPTTAVLAGLRTWLGPTLGSPLAEAAALPGARSATSRPFGATGPAVTVVHVPGSGVDVVFSDAVHDPASRPDGTAGPDATAGRITTVEVRHPRARGCSTQALEAVRAGATVPATDLAMGPDGVSALPVGTAESVVLARPGVQAGSETVPGCRSYAVGTASGGRVRVVTLDGLVVMGEAFGPVPSELGVAAGDTPADVLRAFPQLAERTGDGPPTGTGFVEVVVGDRVVRIELGQAERWVPEVDVPVRGATPEVRSLSVRTATAPPSRLC